MIGSNSSPNANKKDHPLGGLFYWQRMRDSNPRKRSQSPVCYRYTNPLYTEHLYYMQFSGKVKLILRFPPIKKAASAMAANAAAGPALFFKVQHKIYSSTTEIVELWFGAGYGNRTRLHGLGNIKPGSTVYSPNRKKCFICNGFSRFTGLKIYQILA